MVFTGKKNSLVQELEQHERGVDQQESLAIEDQAPRAAPLLLLLLLLLVRCWISW